MTDAEILRAAREFLTCRGGATTERLADRCRVDVASMSERLMEMESRGKLLSVPQWIDDPGMGGHRWVRPGETAECLTADRYDEFEHRVRALAAWKGYTLVTTDTEVPPGRRRYTIVFGQTADPTVTITGGQRIETALWKLRHLPTASELRQPESGAAS